MPVIRSLPPLGLRRSLGCLWLRLRRSCRSSACAASFSTRTCHYRYHHIYLDHHSIPSRIVRERRPNSTILQCSSDSHSCRIGAFRFKRHATSAERLNNSSQRIVQEKFVQIVSAGEGAWRIIHRLLGITVLTLGLVNISLGVFLAVLPLAVWLIWYIYLIILVLLLVILEIMGFLRRRASRRGPSLKLKGRQSHCDEVSRTRHLPHLRRTDRVIEYTIYNDSE